MATGPSRARLTARFPGVIDPRSPLSRPCPRCAAAIGYRCQSQRSSQLYPAPPMKKVHAERQRSMHKPE